MDPSIVTNLGLLAYWLAGLPILGETIGIGWRTAANRKRIALTHTHCPAGNHHVIPPSLNVRSTVLAQRDDIVVIVTNLGVLLLLLLLLLLLSS
jgi:hypothetical protein